MSLAPPRRGATILHPTASVSMKRARVGADSVANV